MKFRYIITGVLSAAMLFASSSCKKAFVDTDMNKDPNNPVSVSSSALLPSVEVAMGYTFGSDFSRWGCLFSQQITGADRQFASYQQYVFSTQDFDNVWSLDYGAIMKNLQIMIKTSPAGTNGYNPYASIAKILMAYSIVTTTDYWGDVPYSDAFNGLSGLQPKYDKQQDIYTAAHGLLADAIKNLNSKASKPGTAEPGADDVVYGGNINQWIKVANVLQARLYIHVSKIDNTAAQKALDAIAAGGFTGNGDDFQVIFGNAATSNAPYFQFEQNRGGYLAYTQSYWYNTMVSMNDPRLPVLIDTAKSTIGRFYGGAASPVPLVTNVEQKFIQAEAYARLNNFTAAGTAYADAVTTSCQRFGVAAGPTVAYLAANPFTATTQAAALQQIMLQKYLAMYLSPEVFTDWRRTGVPALTPSAGTQIPRRFLYPQQEISYNLANVNSKLTFFSKVWWDQ